MPVPEREEASAAREPRLDDRILQTLTSLSGTVAFSGLRRALRAHPESLSRALRRLEREGLVERADGGYRALSVAAAIPAPPDTPLRTIAEVALTPGPGASELRNRLAGRWFGTLRWVGTVKGKEGQLLIWSRRDAPGNLLLSVEPARLRVLAPETESAIDAPEIEEAAYELLLHVLQDLRPQPALRSRGAVFLSASPDPVRFS